MWRAVIMGWLAMACHVTAAQDDVPVPVPIPQAASKYLDAIESHMDYVTEHSLDELGERRTAMWLATIDIRTNSLPSPLMPAKKRWHGDATSPGGSNLYWDQPCLVAAYQLSVRTGCACYEDAADAYARDFLKHCVDEKSGLFDWGHHRYYDVKADQSVASSGGSYECRPHTPAWETLWKIDPEATERAIRAMAAAQIKDPASGLFDRIANMPPKNTHQLSDEANVLPHLDAGAVLIDSLCWLANKKEQREGELTQSALRVARFSYSHRHPQTKLVRNQPVHQEPWDNNSSSTEVGLWAGSLVRATEWTGVMEFQEMADVTMKAWLTRGFDTQAKKYYGRLSAQTGQPMSPNSPRGNEPPKYAEVFDLQPRPNDNYPMPMAETCIRLYQKTQQPIYEQAVARWVEHIRGSLPANQRRGAYAEDYGRVIHFLVRASHIMERPEYRDLAEQVADEAMQQLYVPKMGMFRSHPGEDRCDAVDGPGILILALLYLDGGELPESAFAF